MGWAKLSGRLLLCLIGALLAVESAQADPPGLKTLAMGAKAPDFQLPGVDGKSYSLKDFADSKVLVVVFTCNHCPSAQAYEGRLAQFQKDYKDKGVALVAISPNDDKALRLDELGYTDVSDSFEEMKLRAKEKGFQFPYLYDGETQTTALAYGALATPHVFVFDADRNLRYTGRFDDSDVKTVKSHDTRNAVDALLVGTKVPVEKTRAFGCSTKWSDKRESAVQSIEKWNAEPVSIETLNEASLKTLVKNEGKSLLMINLWATWCGPCVTELPELVTINRMYRKRPFKMVTISLDEPEKKEEALKVLTSNHVAMTNYLLGIEDKDQFAELLDKEWPGPVPYTLLIEPGGKVLYRKVGSIDPLELRRAIVNFLGRTY